MVYTYLLDWTNVASWPGPLLNGLAPRVLYTVLELTGGTSYMPNCAVG
jgi:hypothetical protein